MSPRRHDTARRIIFVAREMVGESLRSAAAIKQLDAIRLLGICEPATDSRGEDLFDGLAHVDDVHDPDRLIAAARGLTEEFGPLHQVVTARETLLGLVAETNEALGLRGLGAAAVRRALDKSHLRRILERSGAGTARGALITCDGDARTFADEVGFPIILKPLRGSGGLATWRIHGAEQLSMALELMKPSPDATVLAEEVIRGEELCIDTITIADIPRFHSICCYRPSILEALEDPRIQWTCVMPREIDDDRYREFIAQGLSAVRALAVGNAVTHMEGFLTVDGRPRFTDATLRPAGARIGPMLGFAYDIDPYRAWARAAVDGRFDGPWERRYAVGTVFLRGDGEGRVERVDGVGEVISQLGDLLVESRVPRAGAPKSATYTGDGYMTVRHPETRVVEEALRLIAGKLRITDSHPATPADTPESRRERWARDLGYFHERRNNPSWDQGHPPGPGGA